MPALIGVIETSLYANDLDRASRFYEALFDLARIEGDDRFRAYSVGGRSVLLLFKRAASDHVTQLPGGTIGAHDGSGALHFAFAIQREDLAKWETKLTEHQVAVEHRLKWPRGGTNLYLRDPENNSVELATPGVWSIY